MELKEFIDQAFEKYEESPELIDFKEELLTNLQDRLKSLEANGIKRADALRQIQIEFADINKIADEMSLEKKKEVFEMRYMSLRNFVTKTRAAIYTILGVLTVFAIIISCFSYLLLGKVDAVTGVMMLFLSVPLAGFVYLGLTQETATRNPMRPMRAAIYAVAVFVFLFGVILVPIGPMSIFGEAKSLEGALAVLIPFALPSLGVITFLVITEPEHRKAWVLKEAEKQNEWAKNFETSGNAQTFGIMTAALWILAIGAFILLLIMKLWVFSWIPFVVALALMMVLLAYYMKK
ncbi:hypothetical protein [Caldibacillus thermoamylovorans]|uniref:hypothetical protein n=1 Tax=Caldibacillus thermoamylovorans TaxID=35841 RepID=UPI00203EF1BB|nr:hypothetical protein [Caldibacillus thermoamylovorans]MCM3055300.1 hypothetical protein [Caldibacillus thermoamylovorans]